ncbi:MAG: DUF2892 domain-containing protein [Brumimicrobium sp.]|nr:DUF2892 domain-containing protein [Brumimicrobium sp.]
MKKNMGSVDRVIRLMIAATIAVLYAAEIISGVLGVILLILAAVFTLTSLLGFCPLYSLFGIKTCPTTTKR